MDLLEAIKILAAAARVASDVWSNPFLNPDAMPGRTGEPLAAWQAKYDAWEDGWAAEDARQSTEPRTARPDPLPSAVH